MRILLTVITLTCFLTQANAQQLSIDNQGHAGLIHDLEFIENGQKLLSVSEDKTVRVWDVASGTLAKTYRFETEGGVNGRIYAAALSKDQHYLFLGGYFDHENGEGEKIGEIRVLDLINEKLITPFKGHSNVVLDMVVSKDGSKLISVAADQSIIVWDITSPRAPSKIKTISGIPSIVSAIDISENGANIAAGDVDGYIRTWATSGSASSKFKVHSDAIRDVCYVGGNLYSAGEDGQIIKWTEEGKFMGAFDELPGAVNVLEGSADGQYLTAMGRVGLVYSLSTQSPISKFDYHTNAVSAITSASFAQFEGKQGNYVASAGGDDKNILIWETKSGTLERNLVGKGKSVFGIGVNEASNEIAFSQSNLTGLLDDVKLEKVFDLDELLLNQTPESLTEFHTATLSKGGMTLEKSSSSSLLAGGRTINLDEQKDGDLRSFTYLNDGQAIAIGSTYSLKKFKTDGSLLGSFDGHEGEVWALTDFASENLLLSASNDQTIKIWNNQTGENLVTLFVASDNEWVIWTPQGFYEASAGGEKYIGWHINMGRNSLAEFHDVSAFSTFYHRPDVIKAILDLKSYDAVASQLNLTDKPAEKIDPPVIKWITEPNLIVKGNKTSVSFTIQSHSPVSQLKLLADGRPIYHESDLSISGDGYAEKIELDVELPEGTNQSYAFTVFAVDEQSKVLSGERMIAFESIEEDQGEKTSEVEETEVETYEEPAEEPAETYVPSYAGNRDNTTLTLDPVETKVKKSNLYMVSIGVSEFADSSLDLRYADDDADAIDELFKGQKDKMFSGVTSLKLTNENATRAKILKTFQRLEEYTTVDDFVIIFIATHGMNVEDNFYIVPHDGDARNPRISCIDWRDFSDLVGNMSARVVLFIDTCHSGQLGNNMGQKSLSNTEAVRELSGKEYGVVIMAAATGYEYSLEHPDWGHGAFTLSLIEGLQEGKADVKKDGIIYLRELDYYLSERVQELTGGRQHPTTQKPSSISRLSLAKVK
ncbi:caspase family protein [Reichenbachiella ulvae]|uniref:Caspase family protein n=1 Tax=Reichenbachiella ulvae TaxID=2980104 RepID=A0ABT3D0E1_9BACT|nr:caspase family protein [Reichenbachiella ulvae]MCV9389205.1 caspase family protein [Reichenbachiella ulvae]